MNDSHRQMIDLVMPRMLPLIGGGNIYAVETIVDNEFASRLDMECGVDLWQRLPDGGHRPIASRVQWGERAWDTFTIRRGRPSGKPTEYHKLKRAISNGWGYLYPAITVHAYIDGTRENPGEVLSAGAARTPDVMAICDEPGCEIRTNGADGTEFMVVPWDTLRARRKWCAVVSNYQRYPDPAPRLDLLL